MKKVFLILLFATVILCTAANDKIYNVSDGQIRRKVGRSAKCPNFQRWDNNVITFSGDGDIDSECITTYNHNRPLKLVFTNGDLTVYSYAFSDVSKVGSIVFESSTTVHVEMEGFYNCTGLTQVEFNGEAEISQGSFYECPSLTKIDLPSSVTFFGNPGIICSYCKSLLRINVDSGGNVIKSVAGVVYSADGKVLIQYPAAITGSFDIPTTVNSIYNYAFMMTSLSSVTIPSSVTSIGKAPFMMGMLSSITVNGNNGYFSSNNGVLFDKNEMTLIAYPCGKGNSYTIPDDVTKINDFAFFQCESFSSVTFPSGIQIGNEAFYRTSLTSLDMPSSVIIGNYAFKETKLSTLSIKYGSYLGTESFAYCSSLISVNMESVLEIGERAFYHCDKLTSFEYLSAMEPQSVGSDVFKDCDELKEVCVPTNYMGNTFCGMTVNDDCEKNKCGKNFVWSLDSRNGVLTVEGKDVYSHQNYYVEECSLSDEEKYQVKIVNMTNFKGDVAISNFAFSNLPNLVEVHIPVYVSSISHGAFSQSNNIELVFFEGTTKPSCDGVFSECTKLKCVTVPSGYSYSNFCGIQAKNECSQSCGRYFNYELDTQSGVLTVIGDQPSIGTYNVEKCSLSNQEKNLVKIIKMINFKYTVKIGDNAFSDLTNLKEVHIPGSVDDISSSAFEGCNDLEAIFYDGENKPSCFFSGVECINVPLGYSSDTICNEIPAATNCSHSCGGFGTKFYWTLDEQSGILTVSGNQPSNKDYDIEECSFSEKEKDLVKVIKMTNCKYHVSLYDGFSNLPNLKEIHIPGCVNYISSYAFDGCNNLETIFYDGLNEPSCMLDPSEKLKCINVPLGYPSDTICSGIAARSNCSEYASISMGYCINPCFITLAMILIIVLFKQLQ